MAFELCKYKNLFGEPNSGIRKYRVFNIALFDTLIVVIIGIFISRFLNYPLWMVLLILFVTGIIAHRLFCVRTGIDKLLFHS